MTLYYNIYTHRKFKRCVEKAYNGLLYAVIKCCYTILLRYSIRQRGKTFQGVTETHYIH